MSRIKTRETRRDIKVLDKAAVAGERMKNAFIRSKDTAANLIDDGQVTPDEYAQDKVQHAAGELAHDTGHRAAEQGKKLAHKGREAVRERIREKPAEVPDTEPAGRYAQQSAQTRNAGQARQTGMGDRSTRRGPVRNVEDALDHSNAAQSVERGRQLAKDRAQIKRKEAQQIKGTPSPHSADFPTNQTYRTMRLPRSSTFGEGPGTVKTVERTERNIKQAAHSSVKTAQKAAKSSQKAIKTAEQTSKAAIKTAQTSAKAAQRSAQAAAKTAQRAAQAARETARATVAAAKAAAKAVAAAVKAIIAAVQELIAAIAAGGWAAVAVIVLICLIGLIVGSCFGIFFSSQPNAQSSQTMVEVVREINDEYTARLDEIKSGNPHDDVEMSGSRAVWKDVLSVYAVKTTTDPDEPQEVASMSDEKKQLLKDIFWAMNEISFNTAAFTETELVETDDGEGNIVTEEVEVEKTRLYITVTHKTAAEMAAEYDFNADQLAQMDELLDNAYNSLWAAVLYGITSDDDAIVAVALSQIGNVGGQPYWSWYGFGSRVEWCACFVSWCAEQCGYLDAGVIPRFAGCEGGSQWFKDRGQWMDRDAEPTPGTLIFFDWYVPGEGQDGSPDHVGIVEKVENGRVYTIEGNSNDACRENSYPIGYFEIYGYGIPAY